MDAKVITLYLDPNVQVISDLRALADSIEQGLTAPIDQAVIVATDLDGDVLVKMMGKVNGINAVGLLTLGSHMASNTLLGSE